jgi:hypothetical protein
MDINATEPTDAEVTDFHPVFDVPGPVTIKGDLQLPNLSLSALPPESQEAITTKLASVTPGNRDLFEREFITEEAQRLALEARIKAGAGEAATPYQRAYFQRANEVRLLEQEAAKITAQLQEVTHYEHDIDPETGGPLAVPVPRAQGDIRSALEIRLRDIGYELAQKNGREGEKLMADAMAATKAQMKAQREAVAEMEEADEMADRIAREERVRSMAETKARFKRLTGL